MPLIPVRARLLQEVHGHKGVQDAPGPDGGEVQQGAGRSGAELRCGVQAEEPERARLVVGQGLVGAVQYRPDAQLWVVWVRQRVQQGVVEFFNDVGDTAEGVRGQPFGNDPKCERQMRTPGGQPGRGLRLLVDAGADDGAQQMARFG
ncbi:hypothetical protein CG747_41905 [Streptomyces sp. CB02959]|nr:hypothetical protein CG747_41905 [Streptomyces sp. CB02959]